MNIRENCRWPLFAFACATVLLGFAGRAQAQLAVAEELLVDLDAVDVETGDAAWPNNGAAGGNFVQVDVNDVEKVDTENSPEVGNIAGARGVHMNSTAVFNCFRADFETPAGVTGVDPTRSIEVWVFNPEIPPEETLVSFGRRGGPGGSNMSFNYGTHGAFGAVGHWGGADIGWADGGGAPVAGQWHHLAYTYDGTTTRVYADGCIVDEITCEINSEVLGAGAINTHADGRIVVANQIEANGVYAVGLRGQLSIGRIRIHDGVLSNEDIQNNFDFEVGDFLVPALCSCTDCPSEDSWIPGNDYTRDVTLASSPVSPITDVRITSPDGATVNSDGSIVTILFSPAEDSPGFTVTLECENSEGTEMFSWDVSRPDDPPEINPELHVAGDLLVNLCADHSSAGSNLWVSGGLVSTFNLVPGSDPVVEEVDGVTALSFSNDLYVSDVNAPPSVTGVNATRTIEVWAYNPDVVGEETMVAWGARGGPNGSNVSFNYGNHGTFGAVGHWGAPDIGWVDNANTAGNPEAGFWHHLVYTYDGSTTRVYSDGVLQNSETLGDGVINTKPDFPFVIGGQNEGGGGQNLNAGFNAHLSLAKVRIHSEALSDLQIFENYNVECGDFQGNCLTQNTFPAILNDIETASFCPADTNYTYQFLAEGVPPPEWDVVSPAGATIDENGLFTYVIPDPVPASFEVEVTASNVVGSATATHLVERQDLTGGIQVAGDLFVDISAANLEGDVDGPADDIWLNDGELGDLVKSGDPLIREIGGVVCVNFNEAGNLDAYASEFPLQESAPGLVGVDATRSIEAWVFNPAPIPNEETVLSWGKRGGPDGSNMSFNYGVHGNFGAVGHWGGGGPDLGWIDNTFTAGAPEAGVWHHLAYTYDGTTTRVYSDGVLMNSEELGAGVINTHGDTPFVLAQQWNGDAMTWAGGLAGRLAIASVRVHDDVLSPCQISHNYDVEREAFENAPQFVDHPVDDTYCSAFTEYRASVQVAGTPIPALSIDSLEGATISQDGSLTVPIPDPGPASFEVTVTAANDAGEAMATWTVSRQDVGGDIIETDAVWVDLDVRDLEGLGEGPETWDNRGALGDFIKAGDPQIVARTISGSLGMSFNEDGRSGDSYQSPDPTPVELLGPDPLRTIEVWVHNPEIPGEETILSWGKRGGPNGSNMSFNYGTHGAFGAVGHWGGDGPDLGWNDAGGAPEANVWHHLAYTFDGTTTRVYADGVLQNQETVGAGVINAHGDGLISLAQQLEGDGFTFTTGLQGTLSLARVRIMSGVLSDCDIATNYEVEKSDFAPSPCPEPGDAEYGDTHCTGLDVVETGRPFGITHELRATGTDDTGDQVLFTFMVDDGVNAPRLIGPQADAVALLSLAPGGEYSFSVTVDDRPDCDDVSDDATCTAGSDRDTDEDGVLDVDDNCPDDSNADQLDGDEDGVGDVCDNCPNDANPGQEDDDNDGVGNSCQGAGVGFTRGDTDGNGQILLNDSILIFAWLFQGGAEPSCVAAADASKQGQVNLTSGIYGLNFLFTGGLAPPAPFPDCGKSDDPGDLALGCAEEHCP